MNKPPNKTAFFLSERTFQLATTCGFMILRTALSRWTNMSRSGFLADEVYGQAVKVIL